MAIPNDDNNSYHSQNNRNRKNSVNSQGSSSKVANSIYNVDIYANNLLSPNFISGLPNNYCTKHDKPLIAISGEDEDESDDGSLDKEDKSFSSSG